MESKSISNIVVGLNKLQLWFLFLLDSFKKSLSNVLVNWDYWCIFLWNTWCQYLIPVPTNMRRNSQPISFCQKLFHCTWKKSSFPIFAPHWRGDASEVSVSVAGIKGSCCESYLTFMICAKKSSRWKYLKNKLKKFKCFLIIFSIWCSILNSTKLS